jgi:hypothetical protein
MPRLFGCSRFYPTCGNKTVGSTLYAAPMANEPLSTTHWAIADDRNPLGMSLNRSQYGGCSTKYNTPAAIQVVCMLFGTSERDSDKSLVGTVGTACRLRTCLALSLQ